MQPYFRGLEIFGHGLIAVIPRIITKDMDCGFLRIGLLYFLKKTNGRVCIEHFVFPDENSVTNHINDAGKIYSRSSSLKKVMPSMLHVKSNFY